MSWYSERKMEIRVRPKNRYRRRKMMDEVGATGLRIVENGSWVHVIFTDGEVDVTNVLINKQVLREALAKEGVGWVGFSEVGEAKQ